MKLDPFYRDEYAYYNYMDEIYYEKSEKYWESKKNLIDIIKLVLDFDT